MHFKGPIFIASLLLCLRLTAQTPEIDSLKGVVANQADSVEVNALIALSSAFLDTDLEQAMRHAVEARDLALQIKFNKGLGYAYKAIGMAYITQSKFPEAIIEMQNSLKAFDEIQFKPGIANMLGNLGAAYFNVGQDTKALDHHLRAQRVAEEIQDTLRLATVLNNIGGVYNNKQATVDKALQYFRKALPLAEAIRYKPGISYASMNLAEIYYKKGLADSSIFYFERALKLSPGTLDATFPLTHLGEIYASKGDFAKALQYHREAIQIAAQLDSRFELAQATIGLANTQRRQGQFAAAIATYRRAQVLAEEVDAKNELKIIYEELSETLAQSGDYKSAYQYEQLYNAVKDSLYNSDDDRRLQALQFNFDLEKKQNEITNLQRDKELQDLVIERQRLVNIGIGTATILLFIMAVGAINRYRYIRRTNKIIQAEKDRSQELLLNILPEETAKELEVSGTARPRYYESVTVLFTDFKGFSSIAGTLSPQELVAELNDYFVAFDEIVEKHNLEKIKTIGDAYMCAGGIPTPNDTHPLNAIQAALEMQDLMKRKNSERSSKGMTGWELRVGVHTGPVVAGVVGKKKYAYDIWGDTVNIASRMESGGEPGRVNISDSTYRRVRNHFECEHRGKISAKNIGDVDMYFVVKEVNNTAQSAA